MRSEHLRYLACPTCRAGLAVAAVTRGTAERVEEGTLACRGCGAGYPVVRHVPRFVGRENYAVGFGFQWRRHASTQLDEITGTNASARRFFEETRWPRSLEGEVVLEAGAGAGRFTSVAAGTGALVVAFDYSEAVDANYATNGHRPNVLIVQGDIFAPPVPRGAFDRVFCLGVLQHTPDPARAWKSLVELLKEGGSVAVDVYSRRWFTYLAYTKYWVRPITRRVAPERLYRWTERYVHALWPVVRLLGRIPGGARISGALLVADNGRDYGLSDELRREWAVLDTFDTLHPAYDRPQSLRTVRRWLDEAGLEGAEACRGWNGVEARGRKPVRGAPDALPAGHAAEGEAARRPAEGQPRQDRRGHPGRPGPQPAQ
jgi:SAM-dependent methyltransferase/uncharacterized protein YbaR (Trm112 family)